MLYKDNVFFEFMNNSDHISVSLRHTTNNNTMTIESLHTICFSPTGTSRKIALAVSRGMVREEEVRLHDLTHTQAPQLDLGHRQVALFAVPVYGGHVPPIVLQRLEELKGDNTPAILVAVYGNRAFENTLNELSEFVSQRGFTPIAAGAFVGEHSYSCEEFPIAVDRPDEQDIARAEEFGRTIAAKLTRDDLTPIDVSRLKDTPSPAESMQRFVGFIMEYRRRQAEQPVVLLPHTDEEMCAGCGACVGVCPTQAIDPDDVMKTDPTRCIRCCACVKICRTGARQFHTPFSKALSENFGLRKEPVTLPDR